MKMKHYKDMTPEQALTWMLKNDKGAEAGFWEEVATRVSLVEDVGINLRDFGSDTDEGWSYWKPRKPKTKVVPLNKLYIDQYGDKYYARTVKELREKIGGGSVSKMYCDGVDGKVYHIGYCIGKHWFNCFTPMRVAA